MDKILIQVLDKSSENSNILKIILEKKSYFQIESIQSYDERSADSHLLFVIDPINNAFNLEDILNGETPVIISSNNPTTKYSKGSKQEHIVKKISYPFKKIEVLSHIYDHMGTHMKEIETKFRLGETFYPIKPKLLKNKSESAPFSIYLKVGAKHLKVLEAGSKNFNKALSIYEDKGVKLFFINQKDYFENRDYILNAPLASKGASKEEQIHSVNEFFHSIVEEIGVGKSSIKIADKLSIQITESLSQNKKTSILNSYDIQNTESEFIYNHSYMTSLVCSQIVSKMGLDSRTIGKKLITACLFHDLAILDSKAAMMFHFNPDGVEGKDIKTRNLMSNHHLIIANILQDHIEIDGDTIQIIKDSHIDYEVKSKLNQLRPLSFIFHLAHTYVVKFFASNLDASKGPQIIEEVANELECEKHKGIIETFKESFV